MLTLDDGSWSAFAKAAVPLKSRGLAATALAGGPMTVDGYRRTIRGACDRAGVPHWSPGRVRHTSLTLVRAKFGLEAAQHAAGHQRADITELYAQRNRDLARRVAEEGFLPRAE